MTSQHDDNESSSPPESRRRGSTRRANPARSTTQGPEPTARALPKRRLPRSRNTPSPEPNRPPRRSVRRSAIQLSWQRARHLSRSCTQRPKPQRTSATPHPAPHTSQPTKPPTQSVRRLLVRRMRQDPNGPHCSQRGSPSSSFSSCATVGGTAESIGRPAKVFRRSVSVTVIDCCPLRSPIGQGRGCAGGRFHSSRDGRRGPSSGSREGSPGSSCERLSH